MIKGAPDMLLGKCAHYMLGDGTSQPLTDAQRSRVEAQKDFWSADAKRVILLARKVLSSEYATMSPESQDYDG